MSERKIMPPDTPGEERDAGRAAGAKRSRIYLAGPLFSEAEIRWGAAIKAAVEERFEEGAEVIWPHEITPPTAALPEAAPDKVREERPPGAGGTKEGIFERNLAALEGCDIVVAVLDGAQVDDGTAWEMGFHHARKGAILGMRTDFRSGGETPESRVNAMVEGSCNHIASDLEELLRYLEDLLGGVD